ncbi:hypothetical protein MMC18_000308 [Xylographa bjoerkii]|nr:hypothetical protein [Xylographa bjoerkii]
MLAIAANPDDYNAAEAAAAKKGVKLQVGQHYAFKSDGKNQRVRLVVGVVSQQSGSYDFQAMTFELALQTPGSLGMAHIGAKVKPATNREGEHWDRNQPQNFQVQRADVGVHQATDHGHGSGETLSPTENKIVLDHHKTYNILFFNCQAFVRQLFKQIQARNFLHRVSQLDGRDMHFFERDLYERYMDAFNHPRYF